MDLDQLGPNWLKNLGEILGYLNFSSGASDPRFLRRLNELFGQLAPARPATSPGIAPLPTWQLLGQVLVEGLGQIRPHMEALRQAEQAEQVLRLVFEALLPAYRQFHHDLLFHQSEESLFQPLFLGRAFEAVLAEGGPWHETERIVSGALGRLNNFLGHRPVAVLRTAQKIRPYAHEWVCPIPLFIEGAGVAVGRYHDLIAKTLEILGGTEESLLRQAWFDPALLEELAVDPRAFDFDHPVNRRPNYHFGGWDPHRIDQRGHYRRFVVQQVTVEALLSRVEQPSSVPREDRLFEAAAVLAGTMLMGAGITGNGPDAHDSNTTLASLLPHIAAYRDAFYERLLRQLKGEPARRLRAEARSLLQPFGGARQHLNQALARRRAEQLQHVRLAQLFARIGYIEAAGRQVSRVPVASARMKCDLQCRLTVAHLHLDRGELEQAAALLPEIEDLLDRAIQCGALVDPWNILGFGGQFSLFPAVENSVRDHRVDELIELMGEIFALDARLEKEAAAAGQHALQEPIAQGLRALAQWWDKYGSTEVGDLHGISGAETAESAAQVAAALTAWRAAGTAAGDVAFWRQHVEEFHSPKAYALLVESLLEHHDPVAAMALLMHWLSQSEAILLDDGSYSFFRLALDWMESLWHPRREAAAIPPHERWPLTCKFLDYLEANADDYWHVPRLELVSDSATAAAEGSEERGEGGLFDAAYENVTYRDTTDDGFEGSLSEGRELSTNTELAQEAERIGERLAFLATVAQLWKLAAVSEWADTAAPDRDDVLVQWLRQATTNVQQLQQLLGAVYRYRIPTPRGTHEALVEYDRHRALKDALQERIILATIEMADAARMLRATMEHEAPVAALEPWERAADRVLRGLIRSDTAAVRQGWPELLEQLRTQPLLYVPIARGGHPQRIANSRSLQRVLSRLLRDLPRLGLLVETYRLIEVIQEMERTHPAGPGAVTEFDRLFETGCRGIVECLVVSSEQWPAGPSKGRRQAPELYLIEALEQVVERLLQRWLTHSRNIRISVLEAVADRDRWRSLKQFIQQYGHDLFTQRFMNFGNLRAILHQGVESFLESLRQEPGAEDEYRILQDLDGPLPREEAVRWLELTLEAIVENYSGYIDYNSTTTQSDRGELLYTLLDFLRLQASYDRVAWNLKPVVIAHEVLVRQGRNDAAVLWRRAVARRNAEVADEHLERFERLSKRYGMRLPSVADRLRERFIQPLAIDRLRALVRPAVEERRTNRPPQSFEVLEESVAQFTAEPSCVGFTVPDWLEALEEEIEQIRLQGERGESREAPQVPQVRLSAQAIQEQLAQWDQG